jgi:cytochrome bd-type quinol oxidase subunit 2
MGTTLSTLILLTGALVTGVLASLAGYYAKSNNAEKTRLWNGVAATIGILLALLALFIVIKGHSATESFAFGVMLSFILMIIATVLTAVLQIISLINAGKNNSNSLWFSIGGAITSFGAFLLALVLIIFLL